MADDIIKITFVGDTMCDEMMSGYLEQYCDETTSTYDFNSVFEPMKAYFSNSDYVFANLETPISAEPSNLTYTHCLLFAERRLSLEAFD